jgi:hypothetical protein
VAAKWLGIALFVLAGLGIHDLARRAARAASWPQDLGRLAAATAVAVMAAMPVTALHAVSGMCTALFTCLVVWFLGTCHAFVDRPTIALAWRLALLALATGLTRADGNLIAAAGRGLVVAVAAGYVLPGAIWFAARWSYYGLPLPLPFYVKLAARSEFAGCGESGLVVASAMLVALGPGWLPVLLAGVRAVRRPLAVGLAAALIFLLVEMIPAQIMGYGWRFLYPALPIAAVGVGLGAAQLAALGLLRSQSLAIGAALLGAGVPLAMSIRAGLEEVVYFRRDYAASLAGAHCALGSHLAKLAGRGADPLLAIGDAGAVPFLSGWRTLDTYGLNDPETARLGRHDAARFLARRPDVLVLLSRHAASFDPHLAWEQPLYELARERGYDLATSVQFRPDYHLWILTPAGSPWAQALRGWRPPAPLRG